ncbi:hypothetical protein GDO81_006082 [Engystomops pustulosus]|uniref:Uncharacterized protein n=1 Tax=Engystomops pustulosus TaxID=76066 RepID=A0AAV7CWH2_ENGPU|nr:hypothetical protein GDO81_006082 [Engystomops pustulosus]
MTESVHLRNNLPDLGGPFLYCNQSENEKMSYAVETPYGFQLDLDFLKYVDDIQSGQTLKKLQVSRKPRMPRRSTSSLRSLSSQTCAWVSTESLDLSEDGMSDSVFFADGRTETNSSNCKETLTLRKSNPLSSTPIFKLLPPPPPKTCPNNLRIERTLEETSRRLQQEQLNLHYVEMQDRSHQSSNLSKTRSSPNLTQTTLSVYQNKSGDIQNCTGSVKSPLNSGRSTPSANISPAHLQYIREQMAASLKRLKDLEEQIQVIPALQMKISILERENKQLTYDLEKQKNCVVKNDQTTVTECTLDEKDKISKVGVKCEQQSNVEPTGHKTSKIAELKRLTEKLSDTDRNLGGKKMVGEKLFGKLPPVKEKTRKSVAVGDDVSVEDCVFYYRSKQENKDVAVQASPETKDIGEWVIESLLGLSSEGEKEIQLLQHTVEHQKAVIYMLEDHVKAAADELEELRLAVASRQAMGLMDKDMDKDRKSPENGLKMEETEIACSCKNLSDADIPNNRGKSIEAQPSNYLNGEACQPSDTLNLTQLSEELVTVTESKDEDKELVNTESKIHTSSDEREKQLSITLDSPNIIDDADGNQQNEDVEESRRLKSLVTGFTQVLAS